MTEAMLAAVVLGIVSLGAIMPFVSGAAVRTEGSRMTLAAKLSSDLMEEIICTPFDQIVATYDGYAEAQGQVKDADGVVFADPSYANFSRSSDCEYVYTTQESGAAASMFIRVTVTVSYRGRQVSVLNRLVSG